MMALDLAFMRFASQTLLCHASVAAPAALQDNRSTALQIIRR
jgi:hypothetical protein